MNEVSAQAKREEPRWGLREVVVALLQAVGLFILVSVIAILTISLGFGSGRRADLVASFSATAVFDLGLVVLSARVAARYAQLPMPLLGFRRPDGRSVGYALLGLALVYAILGAYLGVVSATGLNALKPQSTVPSDAFQGPVTVLAAVLILGLAPLCEETFFRGFLFAGLRRSFGVAGAAISSGMLFAVLHFDKGSLIPFTLIGVLLALLYHRTGNLWTNVAVHFLFNLTSFVLAVAGLVLVHG